MANQKNLNNPRPADPAHEVAAKDAAEVLQQLDVSSAGLKEEEAAARLEKHGPNEVAREKRHGWLQRLYVAARNPLVILLTVLAIISFVAPQGDAITGMLMRGSQYGFSGIFGRRRTHNTGVPVWLIVLVASLVA